MKILRLKVKLRYPYNSTHSLQRISGSSTILTVDLSFLHYLIITEAKSTDSKVKRQCEESIQASCGLNLVYLLII